MPTTITPERLPFLEAIEFWRKKIPLPRKVFLQLSEEARHKAFSVAGVNKMDELNAIYEASEEAITKGTTFLDFQDKIADIIQAHGWTGARNWRVWNIYRTNLQVAYNSGRYKQMMEETEDRPYWMYSAINDDKTRPSHLALDKKVARCDDDFWNHFYPPNGFGCRCNVISLSQEEVEARGLKIQTGTEIYNRPYEIPERGIVIQAVLPDAGWDFNPAKIGWDPDLSKYPAALRQAYERHMQGVQP